MEAFHEIATAHCAPALQDGLAAAITALGHTPIRLPSGAGHDAQVMTKLCPSAMLFVRCRGGISHNPAEFASVADMGLAVAALIRFIERFEPGTRMSDFIDRNFQRQVDLLKALVRVPSDNPPGDCAPHAQAAQALLEKLGFKVEAHKVPERDSLKKARHGLGHQSGRPRAVRRRGR